MLDALKLATIVRVVILTLLRQIRMSPHIPLNGEMPCLPATLILCSHRIHSFYKSCVAMTEVTRILSAIEHGDPAAANQLLPLVYDELRRLATARLAHERPGQTLQATALVHEAYVRLVDTEEIQQWDSRGHFFAAAAEAMRRILVESARHKQSIRRGGGVQRQPLTDPAARPEPGNIVALDDALSALADEDPLAAKVVQLRHFAGLGHQQVAAVLDISIYRARKKWAYARAWLRDALTPDS